MHPSHSSDRNPSPQEIAAALAPALGADRLRLREPLAPYTSFRIGGPADVLYDATSADELASAVTAARRAGIPCFVLGLGANILVGDLGVPGELELARRVVDPSQLHRRRQPDRRLEHPGLADGHEPGALAHPVEHRPTRDERPEEQAIALVKAAVEACERYYQAFQFVVWAGKTAKEGMEGAILETVGEA